MIKHYLTGLALVCCTTLALADEPSPAYAQCMDNASSTLAMGECLKAEIHVQDQRLNRVYKQLMGKLADDQQKSLRDVQRKWLTYRDGNCQFHRNASGGTMAQLEGGTCMMDMTRARAEELERVVDPQR